MAAITICSDFGAQKNKVWHCFHCFPIYFPWNDGIGCHDLSFLNVELKPTFSLSSFTLIKRLLSSSSLSAMRVVALTISSVGFLRWLTHFHNWSLFLAFPILVPPHLSAVLSALPPKWKLLSHVQLFATPWTVCIVHGILQARILEWVAYHFSSWSSRPRNQTEVSCIAGGFFINWAMSKAFVPYGVV